MPFKISDVPEQGLVIVQFSGDYWTPEKLQRVAERLRIRNPDALVIGTQNLDDLDALSPEESAKALLHMRDRLSDAALASIGLKRTDYSPSAPSDPLDFSAITKAVAGG